MIETHLARSVCYSPWNLSAIQSPKYCLLPSTLRSGYTDVHQTVQALSIIYPRFLFKSVELSSTPLLHFQIMSLLTGMRFYRTSLYSAFLRSIIRRQETCNSTLHPFIFHLFKLQASPAQDRDKSLLNFSRQIFELTSQALKASTY